MSDVTQIFEAINHGDPEATRKLLPLVYEELRRLARIRIADEPPGQTLQATALVHEAFVRLVGHGDEAMQWGNVAQFFAAAAEAMRRILVESARRKQALKNGADYSRQELDEIAVDAAVDHGDVIALDEALTKLSAVDRIAADLIQLRYFSGMTIDEAARMLDISPRKARRLSAYARAWLHREIQRS